MQTDQDNESKTSSLNADETTKDEAWKEELKNRLFEEYGVIPERYEDLGNGIYQVYIEVGGEGVTEQLNADNQMEWVARMNSIRSRATEIVNHDIIYS